MKTAEIDNQEVRRFGLLLGAIVAGLFGLLFPWLAGRGWPIWPWLIAVLLWAPAIVAPRVLRPVFRAWMALADVLNWIVTRLVLAIVYYLIVVPIGVLRRLAGSDPMTRRWDPRLPSYRRRCDIEKQNNMERPF